MENPDISDWQKLYQAAIQFQQISPWRWMENNDLFAVENPENGETAYCSIMGAGGEEFGIANFLGEKGYQRYLQIFSEESETDDFENTVMTPQLSMLFVSRKEIVKEEMEIIHSLGLKFRGAHAWPIFRSLKPGYVPWYLEKKEARL